MSSRPATASMALLRPPMRHDDKHVLTRTRTFWRDRRDLRGFLSDLIMLIECEGSTGRVVLNFSQGHFASAQFDEQTTIEPR